MRLDEHCMRILADLSEGSISMSYAREEMNKHGDELLQKVLENGFKAEVDAGDWVGVIGSSNENA